MDVRDLKRPECRHKSADSGAALIMFGVLLAGQVTDPARAEADRGWTISAQFSVELDKGQDSKLPIRPQKDPFPAQSVSQEPVPAPVKPPILKNDETKPKKDNGEEGTEKEGLGKKTVSSLILTVKLAMLADPRLFPYEIEVEGKSEEITLSGKVPSEMEKAAAEKIAGAVPTVKSVINKLEVNKELQDALKHKQDEIITQRVKEEFAKSATVTAAKFELKTEEGVVSLSGTVRFQVVVFEAAEAARRVPGVKAVKTDKVKIESEG